MKLGDLRNGASVLVDTNILLYARRGESPQCRSLLARCDSWALSGVITTVILGEFSHRQMMVECQMLGLAGSNPAKAIGRNPKVVRQLSSYADDVRNLLGGGLTVEMVRPEDFVAALELQRQHGLLTNDSLNLAVAGRLGINEIATADANFDQIQGLLVYKPGDLVR